jgi:anti-sigma factor RsiW
MKRAIQVAGKRFSPSAEFRKRIQQGIAPKPLRSFRFVWMLAVAAAVILVAGALTSSYLGTRSGRDQVFSEIADLHVAMLASSSPVDVVSTDRHTVKPWFQGKTAFAFDLPELQNTEFSLLGGRMTYLDQTPGAHLNYDVRKHHISVFVFQERSLRLPARLVEFSRAEETVIQHGNMESGRPPLFRDRRRECRGHR